MMQNDLQTASTSRIDEVLARHPGAARDSLIPILQEVQEAQGYLSEDAMKRVGQHLKLPASKVYGVATFYNQFRFSAVGQFHIALCRGTACHVKGSAKVLDALKLALKIEPGQTTKDGMFSLEILACIGACGLAPAMLVNGETYANVTPDSVRAILHDCRKRSAKNA